MTGSDMDSKLQKYSFKEREEIKKAYCGPIGVKGVLDMVQLWRKKPVVVEAILLEDTRDSIVNAVEFVYKIGMETSVDGMETTVQIVRNDGGLTVRTLEGSMLASFGDYIIKGVKGEFYPCKPDIFHETYDKEDISSEPSSFIFKHNGLTYEGPEEDILALKIGLEVNGHWVLSDKIKVTHSSGMDTLRENRKLNNERGD